MKNETEVYNTILHLKSLGMSTRAIAVSYGASITAADVSRASHEKFPKNIQKRLALDLPPTCPECHQKLPRPPRVVKFDPVQMEAVIAFLRAHEKPTIRVYARFGKFVK